jgi:hypothetical protein
MFKLYTKVLTQDTRAAIHVTIDHDRAHAVKAIAIYDTVGSAMTTVAYYLCEQQTPKILRLLPSFSERK